MYRTIFGLNPPWACPLRTLTLTHTKIHSSGFFSLKQAFFYRFFEQILRHGGTKNVENTRFFEVCPRYHFQTPTVNSNFKFTSQLSPQITGLTIKSPSTKYFPVSLSHQISPLNHHTSPTRTATAPKPRLIHNFENRHERSPPISSAQTENLRIRQIFQPFRWQ